VPFAGSTTNIVNLAPDEGYITMGQTWSMGSEQVVDLAGGNLVDIRNEALAVAVEGRAAIGIISGSGRVWIDAPFEPAAVAAGDTDGNGYAEAILLDMRGQGAVCDTIEGQCEMMQPMPADKGIDAAAGDVDGDGIDEVIFLLEKDGNAFLYIINIDAPLTGQPEFYQSSYLDDAPFRISAGDLDNDGSAEVVGLYDGGYMGFADDEIITYQLYEQAVIRRGLWEMDGVETATDIEVGDTDADGRHEAIVVDEGGIVRILQAAADFTFNEILSDSIDTWGALRVTTADVDGDSPVGILKEGPTPVSGPTVLTTLLLLPPYYHGISNGTSSIGFGDGESTSESFSDSISLSLKTDVGLSAGLFGDAFKVGLSASLSRGVSLTSGQSSFVYIGNRYNISADPDRHGKYYGAVIVSCGCFDAYLYEMDDPAGKLGENGAEFGILVPVGGQALQLSTTRYNAIAQSVGDLPIIEVPYAVGDANTYPIWHQTLDGLPIPDEDLVFSQLPNFPVSDVGKVGWFFVVGSSETNSVSLSTSISTGASLSFAGLSFGVGMTEGQGESHSITIGSACLFYGGIPPIYDDPATTDIDEYLKYSYSVTPVVFRQHYQTADGQDAAYYVVSYSINGP